MLPFICPNIPITGQPAPPFPLALPVLSNRFPKILVSGPLALPILLPHLMVVSYFWNYLYLYQGTSPTFPTSNGIEFLSNYLYLYLSPGPNFFCGANQNKLHPSRRIPQDCYRNDLSHQFRMCSQDYPNQYHCCEWLNLVLYPHSARNAKSGPWP